MQLIFSKCSSFEDREMGVKQSSDGREEDRKGGRTRHDHVWLKSTCRKYIIYLFHPSF